MLHLVVRGLLLAIAAWLAIIAIGCLALAQQHEHLLSVQTASMMPTFRPGDAVLVHPVMISQLQPGDVVSYRSLQSDNVIISHRLTSVDKQSGRLITAGDALHHPDPAFPATRLVGQVTAVAPGLGRVLDTVRRPFGLILLVYVPAAAIIINELKRLACIYARPSYSVRLKQ